MIRWLIFIICVSVFFSFLAGFSVYSDQAVQKYEVLAYNVGSGRAENSKNEGKEGRGLSDADVQEANGPCEVVSFEAYEENKAVLTPAGEYTVTERRECANVMVRNISGSDKHVDDFVFTAAFGDGKTAYGKFDSGETDAKKLIPPGSTYSGLTCFEGGSPVRILNCAVR